jgi:FixJ family two-component response regulator
LPVIIATGHRETDIVRRDHPAQPRAFLFKPYLLKEMQAAIYAALGEEPPRTGKKGN